MNVESKSGIGLRLAACLSAVAFAAVLTVNALATILPLNGVNTGALSDEIPNLFVPAGLTFSIWGLIYILLAGYLAAAIREAWRGRGVARGSAEPLARAWTGRDAALFLVNMAANAGWIFAWHWRQIGLAMVLMLIILETLISLELGSQRKLSKGGALARDSGQDAGAVWRFFLTVPLRVYLGWISVATIANLTALLVKAGWNGFGLDPRIWTVLVIAAGLLVALGFSLARRQLAAPLVVVWAYAGIVIKRTQADAAYSAPVWIAAGFAALLILLSFALARLKPASR